MSAAGANTRHPMWDAIVCVPVRDEAAYLPRLFFAMRTQTFYTKRFALCLLFDGCEDGGVWIANGLAEKAPFDVIIHETDRKALPNAGRARSLALQRGLQSIGYKPNAALLSTDADSAPAPDWIAASIKSLENVDVVAGHILRDDADALPIRARLEAYLRRLHALRRRIDHLPHDPAPSHPTIGGASLGMNVETYLALGGIHDLPAHEDMDFVRRAILEGHKVRHDPGVQVYTSSRRVGRAPAGLAEDLRNHTEDADEIHLEHPADAIAKYQLQSRTRHAFSNDVKRQRLADLLGVSAQRIAEAFALSKTADAFVERLSVDGLVARTVSLAEAEAILAHLEQCDEHKAA